MLSHQRGLSRSKLGLHRTRKFCQSFRSFTAAALVVMSLVSAIGTASATTIIHVANDPGGNLEERIARLEAIRSQGQRVEIERGYCRSACTLYLGLPTTCISPEATFGFHGPSTATRGLYLPPREFEYWTNVMADYYPPQIRGWFMQTARYEMNGYLTVSGAELIHLGIPQC